MGISKVCAFQKMHRLEALGYGDYEPYKGLKLNDNALKIVKDDMDRHHIIEAYLHRHFDLTHHQACNESGLLSESSSPYLFKKISRHNHEKTSHCCDYSSQQQLTPEIMKSCPWIKRSIKNINASKEKKNENEK
jgi:Mn-dependent DtxR family transcriptional regulator